MAAAHPYGIRPAKYAADGGRPRGVGSCDRGAADYGTRPTIPAPVDLPEMRNVLS